MYFPKLNAPRQSRVTVNRFPGLDRRPRGQEGSFREMENLCAQGYPTLTVRCPRGIAGSVTAPGGLTAKDGLIWVDGHTLYINGSAAGLVLSEGKKQLVSMGAWLLIWPDKLYINTKDLTDFGSLENKRVTEGEVSFTLCRPDGTAYSGYLAADTAPEEPESGSLWLDTGGEETALRQYGQDGWTEVDDVCVGLHAAGIGVGFRAGDGVSVSGCREEALNGSFQLRAAEEDSLVVTALPGGLSSQTEPVTVERSVPDMDYVVESGNRLWGCKYGIVDGQAVNAVYASKLGDFKNWNCFAGLSTDSYAASRGSDGKFTGAADYLGSPLFFKENCVERVYPSANGAHQIVTVQCPGVKDGSGGSLQVVDGKLYYHSQGGVCVFDGSMPVNVSQALGEARYHDGVAGAAGLSAREAELHAYRYVTGHCVYDLSTPYCGTPYGALVEGRAKCDGTGKTMQWILEQMGIVCLSISGAPLDGGNGHQWNVAEIDGIFYDLDATADLGNQGDKLLYGRFNVDNHLIRDLYPIGDGYLSCFTIPGTDSMSGSYHARNHTRVESDADCGPILAQQFSQVIQKNGGSFAIQLAQSAQVDELSRIFGKWEDAERFLKEYGVSLQGFGYYSLTQPETNVYQFTVYRDS